MSKIKFTPGTKWEVITAPGTYHGMKHTGPDLRNGGARIIDQNGHMVASLHRRESGNAEKIARLELAERPRKATAESEAGR